MSEADRYTMWSRALSAGSEPARLIVCERTGRWAMRLRRECGEGLRMEETRSLADAWEALRAAPESFLVVELAATAAEGLIERLPALERHFPLARAAVVAGRRLAVYKLAAREAGAVDFVSSGRGLRLLADAVRRHLAAVPQSAGSLTEQVWAGLPWGKG
jgi:ActR/RegA family two-component response regulator